MFSRCVVLWARRHGTVKTVPYKPALVESEIRRGDHWSPVPVCLVRCLPERTQLRQVGGRAMLAPTFSIGKVDTRFSNGFFLFRLVKNCHIWYTVFLQVHRQTRCKPATQSYRGPSGQPVANKRLLFLLPPVASRPFGAGVDEGENTAIHRRHKAGHL